MSNAGSAPRTMGARTICLILGILLALSLFLPWIQGERDYLGFQWLLGAFSPPADDDFDNARWVSDSRAMAPPALVLNILGIVFCIAASISCARRRAGPLGLRNRIFCIVGSALLVPMTTIMLATRAEEATPTAFYAAGWYLVSALTVCFLALGILAPRASKY